MLVSMTAFDMALPVFSILPRGGNDGVDVVHVHAGGAALPSGHLHSGHRPHSPRLINGSQRVYQRGRVRAQQNGHRDAMVGQYHRRTRFQPISNLRRGSSKISDRYHIHVKPLSKITDPHDSTVVSHLSLTLKSKESE